MPQKYSDKLTPMQQRVLQLDLQGMPVKEIAAHFGVSQARISQIRRQDKYRKIVAPEENPYTPTQAKREMQIHERIVREEIVKRLDPVIALIKSQSLPAAEKIVERMKKSDSQTTELEAAKEILDRAGYVPEKKVTTRTIELSSDDAERMIEAIKYTETRTRGTLE